MCELMLNGVEALSPPETDGSPSTFSEGTADGTFSVKRSLLLASFWQRRPMNES